jgi:hypothetical protein
MFADSIGRKALAEGVGVGATAVSNAVVRGRFPSSWFFVAKRLADCAGVTCPPELFGMKQPDTTQNVYPPQAITESGK